MYQSTDAETKSDLWVVPMTGQRTPRAFLKTPFIERFGAFSPDGRWVTYQSNETGRNEIYVRPFVPNQGEGAENQAGGQWQVSSAGGIMPTWRPDGREIYFLSPTGMMMGTPIRITRATVEPDAPVELFNPRIFGGGVDAQQGRQYDVARDGRFLNNTVLDSAAAPITLLMNWNPDAKQHRTCLEPGAKKDDREPHFSLDAFLKAPALRLASTRRPTSPSAVIALKARTRAGPRAMVDRVVIAALVPSSDGRKCHATMRHARCIIRRIP